jgi:protease-4
VRHRLKEATVFSFARFLRHSLEKLSMRLLRLCVFCFSASLLTSGVFAADPPAATPPADPPAASADKPADVKSGEDSAKSETKEKQKEVVYAHIEISGSYPEGPAAPGIFGEISEHLDALIARIEKAGDDNKITGLVLRINNPELGWAKVTPLKLAIESVRGKGKRVIAYMESAGTLDYVLATACDRICIPEPGGLMMVGMRAEISFYKDLLDLIGLKAETFRVGAYKSAAEPFSRSEMSPEFREEMEEILNERFDRIVNTIAAARKLTPQQVSDAIDAGPLFANRAKELGLIDAVAYEDEVLAELKAAHPVARVVLQEKYGKKKLDTDFSGLTGMVRMIELLTGVEEKKKKSGAPKIAVIYGIGAITTGSSGGDFLMGGQSMGSDTMVKAIRQAAKDDTVKAIVLRVDSPGGSALASDLMWRELQVANKPVVVSMGNVAASGGYYISMGAKRIFADAGTITGSIGVVGVRFAFDGLYKKVGVNTSIITRGKRAGLLGGTMPFTDDERAAMQSMLDEIYAQFTSKAARGRGMDQPALEKLARGRVYTGETARKIGLIDEIGTLKDAIAYAREVAGLKPEEKVEQLQLPKSANPFELLLGGNVSSNINARSPLSLLRGLSPELDRHLQATGVLKLFQKERVLMMMPFHLAIE